MRIQNLLHKTADGKIKGAMSPVLFAQEAAKQLDLRVDGLVRLWFDNPEILNEYEFGCSLTGYDHLAVLQKYGNDNSIAIFVDRGCTGIPVAFKFRDDDKAVITQTFRNCKFAQTLSDEEIENIFNELFKDLSIFDVD